jgi:hypothetical protein
MRIPPRALALAALALLATACSTSETAIGQGMASIVVPIPASGSPFPALPSPSSDVPPLAQIPVAGGVYVGRAQLGRTNLAGVSHRPQRILWSLRPRCASVACPVLLVSKSGGFSLLLRRSGAGYRGLTHRRGFFTCAGKPEGVTLRVTLQPSVSSVIEGRRFATRVEATLQNKSVPSPRCRRSYLNTTVVATRR